MPTLDRYGLCPNNECKINWDGGDILENLIKLEVLSSKSESDIRNIARMAYGYTDENKRRFSRMITISIIRDRNEPDGLKELHLSDEERINIVTPHIDFYMCPSCRKVWDADTGQEYPNLITAKREKFNGTDNQELLDSTQVKTAS